MTAENLRKRKNPSDGSAELLLPDRVRRDGGLMWKIGKCCLFSTTLVAVFLVLSVIFNNKWPWKSYMPTSNPLDQLSVLLKTEEFRYAVVIDAGSTGSRVLAFKFVKNKSGSSLKLHNEFFHEVKPGLSSYAENPEQGAQSIERLIKLAQNKVPQPNWSSTPLVLKATAGLRLLDNQTAENLLEEVRKVFARSGFLVTSRSVSIMSGHDEGIFSWFTINFLLDRLTGDPKYMEAVFDLGGGSTQVTFSPTDPKTPTRHSKYMVDVRVFNKDVKAYTRSYLGLGLMEARRRILASEVTEGSSNVTSSCVNPDVTTEWTYSGATYYVRGKQGPKSKKFVKGEAGRVSHNVSIADFVGCLTIAKELVEDTMGVPEELKLKDVVAISYYYDRAADAGLIHPLDGGTVTVEKFHHAAKDVCEEPNAEQPFACLDLVYISSLLHNGLKLKGAHEVLLKKKIGGHETSWALGAAFHVLTNGV